MIGATSSQAKIASFNSRKLDVDHRIGDAAVQTDYMLARCVDVSAVGLLEFVGEVGPDVAASTITETVSKEGGGAVADRPSATTHHVANGVSQFLENVGGWAFGVDVLVAEDLVVDDHIVRRACGSLQRCLGLEIKVPVDWSGHSSVDHCPIDRVFGLKPTKRTVIAGGFR